LQQERKGGKTERERTQRILCYTEKKHAASLDSREKDETRLPSEIQREKMAVNGGIKWVKERLIESSERKIP